jgi:hypothetical protein
VSSPILLKPGEICAFAAPAVWKQMKTTKTMVSYSGFSTSFRIMKGVSYRVGNVKPIYSVTEGLADVAAGQLCITSKRVAFVSSQRSMTTTHNSLLEVVPYSDGIELRKSSGKPSFFVMDPIDAEYAYMVLNEINRRD